MMDRDTMVGSIGLALATLGMAGVIGSAPYMQAAGAEARGVHALATIVSGVAAAAGATGTIRPAGATLAATVLSAGQVTR